jgi:hypothetical protein
MSDFLGYSLKTIIEAVLPTLGTFVDDTPKEFDSFEDILGLYELGPEAPNNPLIAEIRKKIPSEFLRSILPNGSHDHPLKMPLPNVIKSGKPKFLFFLESFYVKRPVPELEKNLPWLRLNLGWYKTRCVEKGSGV